MQSKQTLNPTEGKVKKIAVITSVALLLLSLIMVLGIVFVNRDDGIIKIGSFYAKPVDNGYMIVGTDGSA